MSTAEANPPDTEAADAELTPDPSGWVKDYASRRQIKADEVRYQLQALTRPCSRCHRPCERAFLIPYRRRYVCPSCLYELAEIGRRGPRVTLADRAIRFLESTPRELWPRQESIQ